MKYLILFLIIIAILLWIAWRFRRQISMAREMMKMLAEARRMINQQQTQRSATGQQPQKQNIPAGGKLVRCEKCQTWVPKDSALSFGGNTYFCSAQCMEKSVINT